MANPQSSEDGSYQKIADEFYMRVGECVTAWAEVEEELFRIFRYCVGPLRQSAIIYYRTPGLEPRFGLTNEIVLSILPAKQPGDHHHLSVKAWKEAKGDYQSLLSFRRRIAHQPVRFREGGPDWLSAPNILEISDILSLGALPWLEIATSEHEALRDKAGDPITVEQLLAHKVGVIKLRDRLKQFYSDVLLKHPGGQSPPIPPPSPD